MKRRALFALPGDINLTDFFWEPLSPLPPKQKPANAESRRAARRRTTAMLIKLNRMKAEWEAKELAELKQLIAKAEASIAADLAYVERKNRLEAELTHVKNFYLTELQREELAGDKARLAKLAKLTEEINLDSVREERKKLESRGVVRGKRKG